MGIIKGTRFIWKDIKEARKYFGTEDVCTTKDKKIMKVFAMMMKKKDVYRALNFARDGGHEFFIKEADDRKGIEICFRHKRADYTKPQLERKRRHALEYYYLHREELLAKNREKRERKRERERDAE